MKREVKRSLLKLIFSVIILFCALTFNVTAYEYNDFEYKTTGDVCSIISYNGDAVGEITVPDTINGKVVVAIEDEAFLGNKHLSGVQLPQTIESIGGSAFSGCSNLIDIVIPDSVTSMGENVFYNCKNLKEAVLSDNLTNIPEKTFYNCKSLEKLELPESITFFGEYSFYMCDSLSELVFPESTSIVSSFAFAECTSLERIYLPDSISFIGSDCFYNCNALKTVYFEGSSAVSEDFSVSSGNQLLMKAKWLTAHKHEGSTQIAFVEATCEKPGYSEVCCSCGYMMESNFLPALGHELTQYVTVTEPSCKNEGIGRLYCSRCTYYEEIILPETEHKTVIDPSVAADCFTSGKTEGSHCYVCDKVIVAQNIIPALGHDYSRKIYDEAHLVSAPTYSRAAVYRYSCSRCSAVSDKTFTGERLLLGKPEKFISDSTSNSITLAWSQVKDADFYGLFYLNGQGKWKLYKKIAGTGCKISSLPAGTTYNFGVRAYIYENGQNIAAPSYVTLKEATRPLKPSKIASAQNDTAIKIAWTPSAGATGYRVYGYNTKTSSWVVVRSSTKECSNITYNLRSGVYYKFAVRPYIDTGSKIVWSEDYTTIISATKPLAPVLKATSLKGAVRFNWDKVSGADGYIIYGSKSPNSGYVRLCVTKNLTYTKSGLASETTFYFRAYSVKILGDGYVYSYAGAVKPAKTR